MVLRGMSDYNQLSDNTRYMQDFIPMNEMEIEIIRKAVGEINASTSIQCTACRYCIKGCPSKIPISEYFALYNAEAREPVDALFTTERVMYLNRTKNHPKATACIECGRCEDNCPQHPRIIDLLKDVDRVFGSFTM